MKFKYYLRGLGIGIVITTIVLMIAYSGYSKELTDEEIIARAEAMGMVKKEDPLFSNSELNKETERETESETETQKDPAVIVTPETENVTETEVITETETATENEPDSTSEMYRLVIPAGSVPRLICQELEDNGVIDSASELRQYLVEVGYATSIVVGEYEIPYGATNSEVYQILKAGPIKK